MEPNLERLLPNILAIIVMALLVYLAVKFVRSLIDAIKTNPLFQAYHSMKQAMQQAQEQMQQQGQAEDVQTKKREPIIADDDGEYVEYEEIDTPQQS